MEPMTTLLEALSEASGISEHLITYIFCFTFILGTSMFIYLKTQNMLVFLVTSTISTSIFVIIGLIPIWIVAVQGIFCIVIFLLYSDGISNPFKHSNNNKTIEVIRETITSLETIKELTVVISRKEIMNHVTEQSKCCKEYFNNLDEILNIQTKITSNTNDLIALQLLKTPDNKYILEINDEFDWFITDKLRINNTFKVVGIHKKYLYKNIVCVLGKSDNIPFLKKIPNEYIMENQTKNRTKWYEYC